MPPRNKKTRRYWPLVALGLIPVLVLVWLQAEWEDSSTGGTAGRLEQLAEEWPTPELDEDGDDIVVESIQHVCDDPERCHVLWADYEASPAGAAEAVIVLADLDSEGDLRRWKRAGRGSRSP